MLRNEKGMSILEVMVAATISIVVAMGVLKINESSQKGFKSIELKSELAGIQNRISGILMSEQKAMAVGSDTDPAAVSLSELDLDWTGSLTSPADITPPLATQTGYTRYREITALELVTGPGGGNTYTDVASNTYVLLKDGEALPGSPNWIIDGALRFYPYANNGAAAANTSSEICYFMIKTKKKDAANRTSVGATEKALWFELSCVIDASGNLTSLSYSSTITAGVLVDNGDTTWGTDKQIYFENKVQMDIAGAGFDFTSRAPLKVTGSDFWNAYSHLQAIELPGSNAITFGNGDEAGILHSGTNMIISNSSGNMAMTNSGGGDIVTTSSGRVMTVANGGDIAMTSTTGQVDLRSQAAQVSITAATTIQLQSPVVSVNNNLSVSGATSVGGALGVTGNTSIAGSLGVTGDASANQFNTTSDERFKKEINQISNALDNIRELRGVTYVMRRDEYPDRNFSKNLQYGFIAQEVEKIFPELVSFDQDGFRSLNYVGLVPVLVESIKEQDREIQKLKKENSEFKRRLERLESILAR